MRSNFFALLSRMKYIVRWSLMRNTRPENLCEHTLDVAYFTHALCVISKTEFGRAVDEREAVLYALYHDCSEIYTGDLPTPVKYHSRVLTDSYKELEYGANTKLLGLLPEKMKEEYRPYFTGEQIPDDVKKLVKAADKLSALVKCLEEERAGNTEFARAKATTLRSLEELACPEAQSFLRDFIHGYSLTLDELD